jgi:hypothetical protein
MTTQNRLGVFAVLLASVAIGAVQKHNDKQSLDAKNMTALPPRDVKVTIGPVVHSLTATTAAIIWSTNVSANTMLRYGTHADSLDQTAQAPWGGLNHRVQLTNLVPQTTYFYEVATSPAQKTKAMSNPASFKTEAAVSEP